MYRPRPIGWRQIVGFVPAAMPAQLPEMCDLLSKPRETVGRKVTGLPRDRKRTASNMGTFSRLCLPATLAGPPVKRISPLGKPPETVGRKAMGAKANPAGTQSQPGRRRNVSCFRKPRETVGRKAKGATA